MRLEILTTRSDVEGRRHLERGVRAGTLLRIRPGACVVATEWLAADPETRHRAAMDALALTSRRQPVFARESAALLHGIPVLGDFPELPHLLDSELGPASRRSPGGTVVHRPRHAPEFRSVEGLLATTPDATALALAASRPIGAGVAALDHVLARGHQEDELGALLHEWHPFHGEGRARRALAIANGFAETPLESLSLAGIVTAGIPCPRQQVEIVVAGVRYRLDFLFEEFGVIGEADGHGKYRTRADLVAEKDREDALRSTGLGFARWNWDDALRVSPMLHKLARAGVVAPRAARYSARARRSGARTAE